MKNESQENGKGRKYDQPPKKKPAVKSARKVAAARMGNPTQKEDIKSQKPEIKGGASGKSTKSKVGAKEKLVVAAPGAAEASPLNSKDLEPTSRKPQIAGGPTKMTYRVVPAKPRRVGITKITIENFKGIADKVEIPIRPITLLFGANSAGKSTILQALLYLRELLEGRNADADRLLAGGSSLDLGGFAEFVHDRKAGNKVRIGVTISLDDDGLPEFRQTSDSSIQEYDLTSPEADHVRDATVTVEVAWSDQYQKPFITSYEVALDGVPFAAIHAQPGLEAHLDFINVDHPVFHQDPNLGHAEESTNLFAALHYAYLNKNGACKETDCGADMRERQRLAVGRSVMPDFVLGLPEAWTYPPLENDEVWATAWLLALLNRTVVGAGKLLRDELRGIRYIGPIRRIPERNFQALRSPNEDRWADGSGAWDLICTENANHDWLSPTAIGTLGLNLQIEQHSFYEVPIYSSLGVLIKEVRASGNDADVEGEAIDMIVASEIKRFRKKSRLQLVSETTGLELQPCEVGIGVSQALPVALGAMAPGYRVLAVEQPELHIHPAIQCNLGDLLAAQVVKDDGRTLLLETHSEHLILRMLRRIRENTEGALPPDAPQLTPEHLSVLWVELENGVVRIKPIPVNAQGDFDEQWPKGFFEERFDEYE